MTSAEVPHNSGVAAPQRPTFFTAAEAGEILRVGSWQAVALCRTGELKATKPGKQWLIDPADLDAYIAAGRNDAAQVDQVSA